MGKVLLGVVGTLALTTGCASWQKEQVRTAVVRELDCSAEHVVARGPFDPATEDGPVQLATDERIFRGACAIAWDERLVMACDRKRHTCRLIDVGPPRLAPPPRL